jgi:predicted DCC family thiol-disulfide oxidoreductase YuxK
MEKIIVVFDGFCVLCNKYVHWASMKNPSKNIYFTNFESSFINKNYPELTLGDTVFVINNKNKVLKKSAAIKHCIRFLKINPIVKFFVLILPDFLLDIFYNIISKNRYKIFGKYDSCTIPKNINKSNILN